MEMNRFVNNIDLFMLLTDELKSLCDSNKLCKHLKQELGLHLVEENSVIFLKFCQKFCLNINRRWSDANRTFKFLKKN